MLLCCLISSSATAHLGMGTAQCCTKLGPDAAVRSVCCTSGLLGRPSLTWVQAWVLVMLHLARVPPQSLPGPLQQNMSSNIGWEVQHCPSGAPDCSHLKSQAGFVP